VQVVDNVEIEVPFAIPKCGENEIQEVAEPRGGVYTLNKRVLYCSKEGGAAPVK
jgi:hypothetical protein